MIPFIFFLSVICEAGELENTKRISLNSLDDFIKDAQVLPFYKATALEVKNFLSNPQTEQKFSSLTQTQQIFLWKLLPRIVDFMRHPEAQRLTETLIKDYAPGRRTSIDNLSVFRKTRVEYQDLTFPNGEPFRVIFEVNALKASELVKAIIAQKINFQQLSISFEDSSSLEISIALDGVKLIGLEINNPDPSWDVSLFVVTNSPYTFDVLNILEDGKISKLEYLILGSIYMDTTINDYSEDLPTCVDFLERQSLEKLYNFFVEKKWGDQKLSLSQIYPELWQSIGFKKVRKGFFRTIEYIPLSPPDQWDVFGAINPTFGTPGPMFDIRIEQLTLILMDLTFSLSWEKVKRSYPAIPDEIVKAMVELNMKTLTPKEIKYIQNVYGEFPRLNEQSTELVVRTISQEMRELEELERGIYTYDLNFDHKRVITRSSILYDLRQSKIINHFFSSNEDRKLLIFVLRKKLLEHLSSLRETSPDVDTLLPALKYLVEWEKMDFNYRMWCFVMSTSSQANWVWRFNNSKAEQPLLKNFLIKLKDKKDKTPEEEVLFNDAWILGQHVVNSDEDFNDILSKISISFDDAFRSSMAMAVFLRKAVLEEQEKQRKIFLGK